MNTVYIVLVDSRDPVVGTFVYAVLSDQSKAQKTANMAADDQGGSAMLRVVGLEIDKTITGKVIE